MRCKLCGRRRIFARCAKCDWPPGGVIVTVPVTTSSAYSSPAFQRYLQQAVQESILRYGRGA